MQKANHCWLTLLKRGGSWMLSRDGQSFERDEILIARGEFKELRVKLTLRSLLFLVESTKPVLTEAHWDVFRSPAGYTLLQPPTSDKYIIAYLSLKSRAQGNVRAHMAVSPTMEKWLYLCQKQLKKNV